MKYKKNYIMYQELSISHRAKTTPASPIRKLTPLADQVKARGITVYHLNIGQPDFEAPEEIRSSLLKYAKSMHVLPYAPSSGIKQHLEGWISYYSQIGIPLSEKDLIITCGGSEAIILALAAITDPNDSFLAFEPFYANYIGFGSMLGITVTPVSLPHEIGYHLPNKKVIESAITPKIKALFVTNPNNPTGTVLTYDEMQLILKIAKEQNLYIISDETYRGISFDGKKTISFLEVCSEEDKDRIIVVDSLSKRLNICGARLGAVISKNEEVMNAINRFAQARLSVATIEQEITVTLLKDSLGYIENLSKEYEKRRNVFLKELEKQLGISLLYPEGAFYTMLNLPISDSDDFSRYLLTDFCENNETVMVAPGGGFYASPNKGKQEIRVAYVLNEEKLTKAAYLLGQAIKQYQKSK